MDKNQNHTLYIALTLCLLVFLFVIGAFLWFFQNWTIGDPTDFADFATYFGNMTLPLLTGASLVFLAITIRHQTNSLKLQKNTEIRKEIEDNLIYHYDYYEKLIHQVLIPKPENSLSTDFAHSVFGLISCNDYCQGNQLGNSFFDPENEISKLIFYIKNPENYFSMPVISHFMEIKDEHSYIIVTTTELVKHLNSTWVIDSYIKRASKITKNLKDINLISEEFADIYEKNLAEARTEALK
ncbi:MULTISPECIES: hypothetical protein [unclassified Methylophaga]|jgi:hypothetical protein|uniref:hypothetical protein n=1 Tax=unclassified Methylophaga TaxID=2629249 RepID=UPI000C93975A|nr:MULTISPECIES: hypothetical protein [unclassified Methylophaga]MAK67489.1 hypothetical protein [Methylophaga sp.]MAY18722.1 hypothetical protein [Methylophaga sp.]HAO25030.1 hypothetical protein [Methylophaga sp.]HCD04487.1 hypothetical protein [Methylophaga sp.]|tara:strand:- start:2928 stop:3647 length:720 start_codon:yes stop_codon:yes gene_type:complete